MSDSRLRELERQAAAGDVQARARLLAERVRVGDLAPDRLQLAAYLGDPQARQALGEQAPAQVEQLSTWSEGLEQWGRDTLIRAALAAARLGLGVWRARYPADDHLPRGLESVERWVADPTPDHAVQVHLAVEALSAMDGLLQGGGDPFQDHEDGIDPEQVMLEVNAASRASAAGRAVKAAVWCAAWADRGAAKYSLVRWSYNAALEAAWALEDPGQVLEALRRELLPWSLGHG